MITLVGGQQHGRLGIVCRLLRRLRKCNRAVADLAIQCLRRFLWTDRRSTERGSRGPSRGGLAGPWHWKRTTRLRDSRCFRPADFRDALSDAGPTVTFDTGAGLAMMAVTDFSAIAAVD